MKCPNYSKNFVYQEKEKYVQNGPIVLKGRHASYVQNALYSVVIGVLSCWINNLQDYLLWVKQGTSWSGGYCHSKLKSGMHVEQPYV